MRRLTATAALFGTALMLSGCREFVHGNWNSSRFKEDFQMHAKLKPGGRLSVDTQNGGVEVIGWEKDEVEITGTKSADTEEHLRQVKIDLDSSPDTLRIRTTTPNDWRGGFGARYVIRVSSKVNIDGITSSNGAVRLENIQGMARVKTSNGGVRIARLEGDLDAHTSNGKVDVGTMQGAATVHTSNGSVKFDELRGSLDVNTSNGGIDVHFADPLSAKPVRLETSNGRVNLSFDQFHENPVRVRSSNGSITLRLPGNVNAQLSASNSHAPITSDFDVINAADFRNKHHFDGKLGSGGPTINLSTSNAQIKVLKN